MRVLLRGLSFFNYVRGLSCVFFFFLERAFFSETLLCYDSDVKANF